MQNHALDENLRLEKATSEKYTTPSKRAYFPKTVSACRRRSSLAAIDLVGDDFSMPDRSKQMKYRLQHRAQQFNRRLGANTCKRESQDSLLYKGKGSERTQ
jgi:hypothetical protein